MLETNRIDRFVCVRIICFTSISPAEIFVNQLGYRINDPATRYIYQISSTATGDFAFVMARAVRIYQPFDSTFSNLCLNAAELAWDYLAVHPNIVPTGGFSNSPGTVAGEYGDSDDHDERLWAAVELYLTTGSSEYHNLNKNSMSK
jgi:hypothetical protein